MTVGEVRDAIATASDIKKELNMTGYSDREILEICELWEAMGWKPGHKHTFMDFRIHKGYYIVNNGTGHEADQNEWYVEWDNGNIGRYQFASGDMYDHIEEEWEAFRKKMMSYSPINYDPCNCHIIYDVENGKKVLEDYKSICDETRENVARKKAKVALELAKAQYEAALREAGEAQ